jgi:hypothetical protein
MHVRVPKTRLRTSKEEVARQAHVRELRGKYAFTKNSSEEFARRKAEEIEFEENIRGDQRK